MEKLIIIIPRHLKTNDGYSALFGVPISESCDEQKIHSVDPKTITDIGKLLVNDGSITISCPICKNKVPIPPNNIISV